MGGGGGEGSFIPNESVAYSRMESVKRFYLARSIRSRSSSCNSESDLEDQMRYTLSGIPTAE